MSGMICPSWIGSGAGCAAADVTHAVRAKTTAISRRAANILIYGTAFWIAAATSGAITW